MGVNLNMSNQYTHFLIGENRLCHPGYEYILKLDEPRLYIKYKLSEGYFADFDEFYESIAEVQWLDGAPSQDEQSRILTEAWNFLCLDEALLEADLYPEDDE